MKDDLLLAAETNLQNCLQDLDHFSSCFSAGSILGDLVLVFGELQFLSQNKKNSFSEELFGYILCFRYIFDKINTAIAYFKQAANLDW